MAQSLSYSQIGPTTAKPKMTHYTGSFAQKQGSLITPVTSNITQGTNKGMIQTPAPTTPVKKITNADGSSTEYHAPATGSSTGTESNYDIKTGLLTATGKSKGLPEINAPKITTPAPTTTPTIPPPTDFTGAVTNLMNQGQSPYNVSVGQAQTGLMGTAAQNLGTSGKSYDEYQQAVNELNTLKSDIAKQTGGIADQPISMQFQQGKQQALSTQNAALLDAAQQKVNEKAAALGYGISGQQAQQAGLQQAGQLGISGQQLAQGALGTAAGLAQPQLGAIGQVPYSPLTGTQGLALGTTQTGGVAGVGALQQQIQQGAQTQTMIGAYNQAQPLIENAKKQIQTAGFNVSPLGLANALTQWVNKDVVPSAQYTNIFNTLSEIATTISPVLGAQGAQTNLKTMIAQEFIPRLMQGQDIGSVLDNIETNALAKIQAQKSTSQQAPLTIPTGGAPAGTTGGSIWDF